MNINLNELIPESNFFTWGEALYLPYIKKFYKNPTKQEQENIKSLALKLNHVREYFKVPFKVNVWIRPNDFNDETCEHLDYNALVGGAKNSSHIYGLAVDGYFIGLDVDYCVEKLIPKLNEFKLSMELNGSKYQRNWIHLQDRPMSDGNYRAFLP